MKIRKIYQKVKDRLNFKAEKSYPVSSSAIENLKYNKRDQVLEITFNAKHKTYRYEKVPRNVVEEFVAASSKGRFFQNHIKDIYIYTQI